MNKIVIFNVGAGLSIFGILDGKSFIVDLGKRANFSPTKDFLVPLAEKGRFEENLFFAPTNVYQIDQLFLTHLDNDHIEDYLNFKTERFHPNLMTCPNSNQKQSRKHIVKARLLGTKTATKDAVLNDMKNRNPSSDDSPLVSGIPSVELFYILPRDCERNPFLKVNYANNLSLCLFIHVGEKSVLVLGDLMKDGISYLINNDKRFFELLSNVGVDYLVAPHHGLRTSFSELLFKTMNDNKVRLNILSEKSRTSESAEQRSKVDSRYYSSKYSTGENSIGNRAIMTSRGHLVIDFDTEDYELKQYKDIEGVIEEFRPPTLLESLFG